MVRVRFSSVAFVQSEQAECSEHPAQDEVPEIFDPLFGELIPVDNVDFLIDGYERIKDVTDRGYAALRKIREALANLCEGDAKTRRVRGERRIAKITQADESWDQKLLRDAYEQFAECEFRDEVLKIATIGIRKREYKKLAQTTGDDRFNDFRDLLTMANRGVTSAPSVAVEK